MIPSGGLPTSSRVAGVDASLPFATVAAILTMDQAAEHSIVASVVRSCWNLMRN